MIEDMDINCGDVLDGVSIEDKGREIFERVLSVASGERTQVGGAGLRRRRIRAVADRRDDVSLTLRTALLFDLDGTLVDSDARASRSRSSRSSRRTASRSTARDYTAEIMGASNAMIGRRFLPHLTPEEREATLDAKEAAYRDGLGALDADRGRSPSCSTTPTRADLPRAVVTNAPRANAELVLRALGLDARLPIRVIGARTASAPSPTRCPI